MSFTEIPEVPVSFNTTRGVKTGTWRNLKPVIEDKYGPCTKACPTNTLIPQYFLQFFEKKDFRKAHEILTENNPFPSVTGRVCPHPCETACNRGRFDDPISIRGIERFLGDMFLEEKGEPPKTTTGKKIAVVGAGPGGMAAAYHLRKKGHHVVVFEKYPKGGGILRYGIPEFRLPTKIVDLELKALERMGIEFRYNTELGKDISFEDLRRDFDVVVLAHGAHLERKMGIPGEENFLSGVEFLREVKDKELKSIPWKKVGVIGGGNVAMDVIRTVKKLGGEPILLYRRTQKEMPALKEEIERALEDEIEFRFLTLPTQAQKINGKIEVTLIRMELGEPDEKGRRKPIPVPGSEHTETFDMVISAIGEYVDTSFLPKEILDKDGWIVADKQTGKTPMEGVYAVGDAVTGPSTVVEALGWAKRASIAIDNYLMNKPLVPQTLPKTVSFMVIQKEYFTKKPRVPVPEIPVEKRVKNYWLEEILGYDMELANQEVSRCFLCGTCNSCGNCYVFCPDLAIEWVDGKPRVDYDYCKGCGVCKEECPRGIITMELERIG